MNNLWRISELAALADQEMERATILLGLLTEDDSRSMINERQQKIIDFWLYDLAADARVHLKALHEQINQQVEASHD